MDEVLTNVLQDGVIDRLDFLDRLAVEDDIAVRAALAETETRNLTSVIRDILRLHQPDHQGQCSSCRTRWWRKRGFPCPVWVIAHRHLLIWPASRQSGTRLIGPSPISAP